MPSNKPRIQALVSEEIYETFKELCIIEDRSESNLGGKIITEYIENYKREQIQNNLKRLGAKQTSGKERREKLYRLRKKLNEENKTKRVKINN